MANALQSEVVVRSRERSDPYDVGVTLPESELPNTLSAMVSMRFNLWAGRNIMGNIVG